MKKLFLSLFVLFSCNLQAINMQPLQLNVLGSHLMHYMQTLLYYSKNDESLEYFPYLFRGNKPELSLFYKELPLKVIFTDEEKAILEELPDWIWHIKWPYSPGDYIPEQKEWLEDMEYYYTLYHLLVSKVCQRVIPETLEKIGKVHRVDYPVIHYRVADLPFDRNRGHHFQKYRFYLEALEKWDFCDEEKKVLVVACNKHATNPLQKRVSDLYLKDFVFMLQRAGYDVEVQTDTILNDFVTMVFAPYLISGGSTYSFMAGMANANKFVSGQIGWESKGFYHTVYECPWMSTIRPLLHQEVLNYYDVGGVTNQLRED